MQTKLGSLVETLTNIGIGYAIAITLTFTILPAWGYDVTLHESFAISAIFTVASVARSYALRRLFNWWTGRTL